jgi:hypothetical protein
VLPQPGMRRASTSNLPNYWNDADQHPAPGTTALDVGTDYGGPKTTITALPPAQYGTGTLVGTTFPNARYVVDNYFTG